MIRRFYLALANLALLVPFVLFVRIRFSTFQQLYIELGKEFDLANIFKTMKHDIFILSIGLLSLIGILFWSKKKTFFLISTMYIATQVVTIFLIPNFSITYSIMVLAAIAFLWFLIWNNTYAVFKNKWRLKLTFLFCGIIIYVALLYFLGLL